MYFTITPITLAHPKSLLNISYTTNMCFWIYEALRHSAQETVYKNLFQNQECRIRKQLSGR